MTDRYAIQSHISCLVSLVSCDFVVDCNTRYAEHATVLLGPHVRRVNIKESICVFSHNGNENLFVNALCWHSYIIHTVASAQIDLVSFDCYPSLSKHVSQHSVCVVWVKDLRSRQKDSSVKGLTPTYAALIESSLRWRTLVNNQLKCFVDRE